MDKIAPAPGARRNRKRVGRGDGSGHGSYSCVGCKGLKARSGGKTRPGFEGGQLPMIKRLPEKRGFINVFRTDFAVVNVGNLNKFAAQTEVTPDLMAGQGLIDSAGKPVKVLGDGEIDRPLKVRAHKFSASAEKKIAAAGGSVERL